MAKLEKSDEPERPKNGFKSILIALILSVVSGAGVGYAVYYKLIPLESWLSASKSSVATLSNGGGDRTFVEMPDIVVSLNEQSRARHLRASLYLEAPRSAAAQLEAAMPRILDIVTAYLRAADVSDLEEPAATIRLRALLLHRVRLVVGRDAVSDLLITEFVFN